MSRCVKHKDEEWVRGMVHTNTVESAWSLLKRSVVGTYHHMSQRENDALMRRKLNDRRGK